MGGGCEEELREEITMFVGKCVEKKSKGVQGPGGVGSGGGENRDDHITLRPGPTSASPRKARKGGSSCS